MTMLRYPGSKAKLLDGIAQHLPPDLVAGPLFSGHRFYVEPFFGAGSVGLDIFKVIAKSCSVWINDIDYGIYAMWATIMDKPSSVWLCNRIQSYKPSVADFYEFRDGGKVDDVREAAFRKIALHQLSFSGLGAMAGGPIGGREQSSAWNVDCRWNGERLQKKVRQFGDLLRSFRATRITNIDFEQVLADAGEAFCYVDPPYVQKGGELYLHSMGEADHRRLADRLRTMRRWVLSYDDCEMVRDLYSWADFHEIHVTYTGATARCQKRPKNHEVIIVPRW